jgi:hypothetical protein
MFHTFRKGKYDFDSKRNGEVKLSHSTDYLDVFFMVNNGAVALLNDYYQLTGNPVLLPKFGFYEGHLNAYNRDYWKENEKGILFEDGKRYSESQKDNGGVKESLGIDKRRKGSLFFSGTKGYAGWYKESLCKRTKIHKRAWRTSCKLRDA